MRNKAVNEWNLLVRSDENAKRNLEAFISSLGMDAEIVFIEDVDVIEEENKELEAISINNNLEAVL